MTGHPTYYDVLHVPPDASREAIKTAYRGLALKLHPDTRPNDPDASVQFMLVQNAYDVLGDASRRAQYDAYLYVSAVVRSYPHERSTNQTVRRRQIATAQDNRDACLSHLNYILWEIEELLSDGSSLDLPIDGRPLSAYLLRVLSFIDRWVLVPAGYGDHFYDARRIGTPRAGPPDFSRVHARHGPYVNLTDYFYNVRVRPTDSSAESGSSTFSS